VRQLDCPGTVFGSPTATQLPQSTMRRIARSGLRTFRHTGSRQQWPAAVGATQADGSTAGRRPSCSISMARARGRLRAATRDAPDDELVDLERIDDRSSCPRDHERRFRRPPAIKRSLASMSTSRDLVHRKPVITVLRQAPPAPPAGSQHPASYPSAVHRHQPGDPQHPPSNPQQLTQPTPRSKYGTVPSRCYRPNHPSGPGPPDR
jgi:hypothetical protein